MNCDVPDCLICQWLCDRIIRFNEEIKQLILATAPPPITLRLWLSGDPE